MKHAGHVIRLAVVLIVLGVAFFAVRSVMVPEGFGTHHSYTYGYFRAASEQEQASLAPVYRGSDKCRGCHEAQHANWSQGKHVSVACETCHDSWQAHNNNTKEKVVKDSSIHACMLCHATLTGRPETFPQIDTIERHVAAKGKEYQPGTTCIACHQPHNPI